jgi:hypothetical protein
MITPTLGWAYMATQLASVAEASWALRDSAVNPEGMLADAINMQREADSAIRTFADLAKFPVITGPDLDDALQLARDYITEHQKELDEWLAKNNL